MTRPKRTASLSSSPSSSDPSKRVAFEIPASLRQLSSISRSLATNTTPLGSSTRVTASPRTQSQTQTQTQTPTPAPTPTHPRPLSQSSSQPTPPPTRPPIQIPPKPSLLQKNPAPVANPKPWLGPPSREFLPVTANQKPTPIPTSTRKPPRPPKIKAQRRSASHPTPTVQTPSEPVLQPGETPSLKTHPNLIASLIAQKRAANEAAGHRARWQRNQAEYRATGKPPESQLATEPSIHAPHASPLQARPTSGSNSTTPRPASSSANNPQTLPPTEKTTARPTETERGPVTESSVPESETRQYTEPQEPDSESVYSSPFSFPITEFLQQATDNAGLGKDAARSSRQPQQPNKFNHQIPPSTTHEQIAVDWTGRNGNVESSSQVSNQSPMTEKPQSYQQNQSPLVQASFPPNSSHSSQHQSPSYPSPHFQRGQLQMGGSIQNSGPIAHQQHHYMNAQLPTAQQHIYKVNYPPQYSTSTSQAGHSMSMPMTMRQTSYAQQPFTNSPAIVAPVPYSNQPDGDLGMFTYASPGSGSNYDVSMTKTSSGPKRVFMTAADMVAGANPGYAAMRFGTRLDFTVNPSR